MRRAAIVSPLRTAVGKYGGSLVGVPAEELATHTIRAVVERSHIDPGAIDDVVFAQSYSNSEAPCIGRWAALNANLPIHVPGMQLDRRCGGGLQALATASMMVQTGAADIVLAGGVESMSSIEYYSTTQRWGSRSGNVTLYDRLDRGRERSQPSWRFGEISGMIETAENLARECAISREDADAFALRSHQRAASAWDEGRFDDEVIPISVPQRREAPLVFARDEGVRHDASMHSLASLRELMPGGVVTAGNSAQQNDAAAACLIVAEDKAEQLGLEPLGYMTAWTAVGCEPATMGIGPVPAVAKLFARTGLDFDDFDLIEVNEAFAVQVLAVLAGWGIKLDELDSRLNVNGGGVSLGHPIGATGVRIMTTALHELRRRGGRRVLETMCVGGGQGVAAVFEGAS